MSPINPLKLLQLKSAWERFKSNHPRFPLFLSAVSKRGIKEGTVIEFKVTTPEGEELVSNIKIKQSDIALFHEITNMFRWIFRSYDQAQIPSSEILKKPKKGRNRMPFCLIPFIHFLIFCTFCDMYFHFSS